MAALPHTMLSECYREASGMALGRGQGVTKYIGDTRDTWTAIERMTHSATRMHGQVEILQKQLQHECVHHVMLQQKMHATMAQAHVQATPYEGIVAHTQWLHEKHLSGFEILRLQADFRQSALELVPHFLHWTLRVQRGSSLGMSSSGVVDQLEKRSHKLRVPRELFQMDSALLEQVSLQLYAYPVSLYRPWTFPNPVHHDGGLYLLLVSTINKSVCFRFGLNNNTVAHLFLQLSNVCCQRVMGCSVLHRHAKHWILNEAALWYTFPRMQSAMLL